MCFGFCSRPACEQSPPPLLKSWPWGLSSPDQQRQSGETMGHTRLTDYSVPKVPPWARDLLRRTWCFWWSSRHSVAHYPIISFPLSLRFLPIQQLSVNGLDYELLQAHGLLLGQKTPSIVWGMAFVLLLSPGNIRAFPFKAAIPWQVIQQLR